MSASKAVTVAGDGRLRKTQVKLAGIKTHFEGGYWKKTKVNETERRNGGNRMGETQIPWQR